jgi:predicted MPP superfamily phosphohydrolase
VGWCIGFAPFLKILLLSCKNKSMLLDKFALKLSMFYGYSAYTNSSINIKIILLLVFALLIELYARRGFLELFQQQKRRKSIRIFLKINLYLFFTFSLMSLLFVGLRLLSESISYRYNLVFWFYTLFVLLYAPKAVFCLFELLRDVLRLIRVTTEKLIRKKVISMVLIKRIFLKAGFLFSIFCVFLIVYSISIGRQHYKVTDIQLELPNLPMSFDGYRIVQISDLHLGSFSFNEKHEKMVELINAQNPDLLVMTGDMVNFRAEEAEDFIEALKKTKAKDGKYAVLGNHDFGDYMLGFNEEERIKNTELLIRYQEEMGFKNLQNEAVSIHRKEDSIALVGVMNWSEPPYRKYGNMEKALENCQEVSCKILLSHDPSHWEKEILEHYAIDLTLSGHTHGAQLGIDLPFYQWCPLEWMHPYWGGLYEENAKYLYVNRGLGVIAFLGRIGMRPEITCIQLKSKEYPH